MISYTRPMKKVFGKINHIIPLSLHRIGGLILLDFDFILQEPKLFFKQFLQRTVFFEQLQPLQFGMFTVLSHSIEELHVPFLLFKIFLFIFLGFYPISIFFGILLLTH